MIGGVIFEGIGVMGIGFFEFDCFNSGGLNGFGRV